MFDSKMLSLVVQGFWESCYMTVISTLFAYIIGLPLGVLLSVSGENGIRPQKAVNRVFGAVINVVRSVPFVILLITVIPLTRLITGTSIGSKSTIVPLVVAAFPVVARSVESSVNGVDNGVIEAAKSIGASPWQIITKVLLPEALPSLLSGLASCTITVLGYSAMAGICGGGGLGAIAINYGYYRGDQKIMYVMVILLVLMVQLLQKAGEKSSGSNDRRIRQKGKDPQKAAANAFSD